MKRFTHSRLVRGSLLSGIVAIVAGTAGCASSGLAQGPRVTPTQAFSDSRAVITAAMLGGPALSPIFTVQGLLEDASGPVNTTMQVYALIRETPEAGGEVIFETERTPMVVVDGLFTIELELPDPEDLAMAGDLVVDLRNLDDDLPVAGPLPMRFAPRAWAAQYARQAGSASSATTAVNAISANSANTAAVANALTNDQTASISLVNGFENYLFSYDIAQATRVGNMVFLSGLVDTDNATSSIFATLPANMRPAGRHIFSASANGQYIRVDVLASGQMTLVSPLPAVGWFSLSGMAFPVAP